MRRGRDLISTRVGAEAGWRLRARRLEERSSAMLESAVSSLVNTFYFLSARPESIAHGQDSGAACCSWLGVAWDYLD